MLLLTLVPILYFALLASGVPHSVKKPRHPGNPKLDASRVDQNTSSFEWWYFDVILNDNGRAVIVYMTKETPEAVSPVAPVVLFDYTFPNGTTVEITANASLSEFWASKEHPEVHVGKSWFKSSADLSLYKLHYEYEGYVWDLDILRTTPAFNPNAANENIVYPGIGWYNAIPQGKVIGTIKNGHGTAIRRVIGSGYHDHNWGPVPTETYLDYWYWGRGYAEDYTFIYFDMWGTHNPNASNAHTRFAYVAKGHEVLFQGDAGLGRELGELTVTPYGLKTYPTSGSTVIPSPPLPVGYNVQLVKGHQKWEFNLTGKWEIYDIQSAFNYERYASAVVATINDREDRKERVLVGRAINEDWNQTLFYT